jgi:UDP-glucose 4-epimerase
MEEETLHRALQEVSWVFHFAGTTIPSTSNEDPVYDVESNLVATIKVLQACVNAGIKKVLFASSGGTIYGIPTVIPIPEDHPKQPLCSYGITKCAIEQYLSLFHYLHGLDYVCLRFANAYGERQEPRAAQGAVAVFLARVKAQESITIWGDGSTVRDYVHVADIREACWKAISRETPSHIYNIGSGQGTSLKQLLDLIAEVTGRVATVRYTEARKVDVPVNVLDVQRAQRELGWIPRIQLAEGIGRTWQWLMRQ